MKKSDFLAHHCADISRLAPAVIRQSGGWQAFKENAPDISRHGIDCGFNGWIYHGETVTFYRANRTGIVDWIAGLADEPGIEPVTMLQSWRCLQDCSAVEILRTIAGSKVDATVANGLAWGIAEEVARRFSDACES